MRPAIRKAVGQISVRFLCAVGLIGLLAGAGASAQAAETSPELSNLAPGEAASRPELRTVGRLPLPDVKKELFRAQPTNEARERLGALERIYENRIHFQTATQADLLDYQHANHDLALWYARALLRAQLSSLWTQIRQHFRFERQHEEARAAGAGGAPAQPGAAERAPASRGGKPASTDEKRGSAFERFVAQASRFCEELTNGGVGVDTRAVQARVKLDVQSAVVNTDVSSPVINVGVSYHLRPSERPLPFTGADAVSGGERLVLTGGRGIPALGLSGSVSYQYMHRSLTASVDQRIVGPLNGHVDRAWDMSGAGLGVNSTASLSMSVYF